MTTKIVLKLLVVLSLLCAGSAVLAQDVKYNYDREANFAAYKTYQWAEQGGRTRDQLLDKDIRRAIDEQLAQKGLQKVDGGGHLILRYETALDRERQADLWTTGAALEWHGSRQHHNHRGGHPDRHTV